MLSLKALHMCRPRSARLTRPCQARTIYQRGHASRPVFAAVKVLLLSKVSVAIDGSKFKGVNVQDRDFMLHNASFANPYLAGWRCCKQGEPDTGSER